MIEIAQMREDLIPGWRAACEAVASERVYLGRVTLPPFDPNNPFQRNHIRKDWPSYVVLDRDAVVGWADVTPVDIPLMSRRWTFQSARIGGFLAWDSSRLIEE